jgi:drug resistance transporter, EmrB/QacA subfamily
MATLDSSIVNVALPKMSDSLSVNTESIAWVVSSYLIVIAGTILVFGRLGDMKGKTNIFHIGVVVFTLGSLLCGISNSFLLLIVARCIQAVGAAATMANNQGIITHVFPAGERGKALGISGAFVALGSLAGPPIGGFLITHFNWEYIFLINVPIGIFVFLLGLKILPKSSKDRNEHLDTKGAALFAISIVALFASLILGEDYGYAHPTILFGFFVAIVSFLLFIIVERKVKHPLLQLSIFRNGLFSLSIFCAFISFVSISSSIIIQPFYLQSVMKFSPAFTGIIMAVNPLIMAAVAPASGHLSDKIGSEFLTFAGLVTFSGGLFLMATLNENSSILSMVIFLGITSIGSGLFQSPNNSLIMSNAPRNMLGITGSVNALIRNLGLITGTAISVLILYNRMSSKIGYQVSTFVVGREDAFIYGMRWVYLFAGAFCTLGALLTAIRMLNRKNRRNIEID